MIHERQRKYINQSKKAQHTDKDGNYKPPTETDLQNAICSWLTLNYPEVRYTSTLNGVYLPPKLAKISKKQNSHRGIPDLIIHKVIPPYAGFYLELKKDGIKIFKVRTPNEYKDEHTAEQADYIFYLRNEGYYADFGLGYVDSIIKIRSYLEGDPVPYTL